MVHCQNCGAKLKSGSNFCEDCGKSLKHSKNKTSSKERPTFLNIWLILMIIASIFTLISAIQIMPLLIPLTIFGIVCIIALFNWKKWGFYGYIWMGALGLLLNAWKYGIEMALISSVGLIIGTFILYFAMKPVWYEFE